MQRFSVGDRVDNRYEISGTLGYGGMAHVYRAHDHHLERDVALKVLRPHLTEADQERFRREIKALAKLSHPGIVSIYDLGRGEYVYFAMELVEGGPFTDLGPLEPDLTPQLTFCEAAISVAEALAYVHRQQMVHRDLTPRNVLLSTQGHPKVMDFGLVRLAEATQQLTRTGFTLGTPHYMAPEQARGELIGAHTDVYALGAVLYRTVTGVAPFEADNDQAVLYQHVYDDPRPPDALNPNVPVGLSRLITSMLAKDPAQRPTSAARVAEALRALQHEVTRDRSETRLGGPAQQGFVGHGPPTPGGLEPLWSTRLSEGPQWPAALMMAQGFIVVGLRSEEVCVLHPADGGLQARFDADDEVNSPVVYSQNRLIYTSRDGTLQALSWPNGAKLWHDNEAEALGVLPYTRDLLVTTARGGLERRTIGGEVLWSYGAARAAATAPIVHRGHACYSDRQGWVHCVDVATGKGKFKFELGASVSTPAAKDGVLLLPERSGALHAFELQSRTVRWSYDLDGELWASPLVWSRYVYVASWAGVVRCLSLGTGDDVWAYQLGSRVTATPVLASGVLYLTSEGGEVFAFDARSGHRLFRDRVSSTPIQASPLVVGPALVVAAVDGTVRAYR